MKEPDEQSGQLSAIVPYLLLALILTVVAFVRVRLLQTPLERDEGEYAYMGQLLLKGIPPFVQTYSMKLPGVSAAYAVIMLLFGQSAAGIHLGLLIVNGMCIFLVFLLARRLFDRNAAVCSCACYAVLSLSQSVYGVYAHATHFVALFALAGATILLGARDSGRKAPLFLSGLCFGLAFVMKQHAALFIAFGLTYLVVRALRQKGAPLKRALSGLALFLGAAVVPVALILLYYAKIGMFKPLWFWTVQYAREYASDLTFSQGLPYFTDICLYLFSTQPTLWLLAGAGVVVLCSARGGCSDRLFLLSFSLFSFLSVCPGLFFRGHYFVMFLPAVALLSGATLHFAGKMLAAPKWRRYSQSVPFALFMVCIAYGLYNEKNYFYLRTPLQVSRSLYGLNPFPEALQVARYLKNHTTSSDKIAVLGSEPEVYFYCDRTAASGHIYMYGLVENQPYAERMQRQMISEIESSHPKYVVLTGVDTSWLTQPSSPLVLSQWQGRYLHQFYQPVGAIDIFASEATSYHWDDKTAGDVHRSDSFLTVYKRKS